jgi:tRNA(Ile)-lysidine synthase
MIKIQGKLPRDLIVACSGGIDSIVVAKFLSKNHNVTLAYFNHQTNFGILSEKWISEWADNNNLKLVTATINRDRYKNESMEEYWRNQRYEWFHSIDNPVITAHHLDDCVETWVWSSMHGTGKIIPYKNKNVIRPFRMNEKSVFDAWASAKGLSHVEDPSNSDVKYTRNYIRHTMMPHILHINPGIKKVIRKKVATDFC